MLTQPTHRTRNKSFEIRNYDHVDRFNSELRSIRIGILRNIFKMEMYRGMKGRNNPFCCSIDILLSYMYVDIIQRNNADVNALNA